MFCKQQVVVAAWRNISRQSETFVKTRSPHHVQCCHISILRVHGVQPLLPRRVSRQRHQLLDIGVLRLASSSVDTPPLPASTPATTAPLPQVPEPPPIPEVPDVAAEMVQAVGEPSFASIGLGGWSPVGMIQNCLEYLHVDCGVPWWTSIVIGTVVVRTLLFPLVIQAQRNAAKMNNYLPQLQLLQLKLTEARETGNQLDAARYTQELASFMKEKGLNPFKNMLVPLAQAPVFISFFLGLRGMTNAPVESMRMGGLFWFTDLIVPDQYFILPIITSVTMYLTIELGTDGARLSSSNLQTMRYVLRALPVCILPFIINFPGAILCYWTSTNFISLIQVLFLKIPMVREYFKIQPMVSHKPETLPVKPKGFVEGVKDSWTNSKLVKELEDRRRVDEIQFQRAGRGALQKTYSFDPTKSRTVVSAKKKE